MRLMLCVLLLTASAAHASSPNVIVIDEQGKTKVEKLESDPGSLSSWIEETSKAATEQVESHSKGKKYKLNEFRLGVTLNAEIGLGSIVKFGASPGIQLRFKKVEK